MDKPTWSFATEFRPIEALLFRGKYGTAFKAPSLADLYQGDSGYYSFVTDYYQCALAGFTDPVTAPELCPAVHSSRQFFGHQSGSTELDPINADNWTVGVVFSPFDRFSIAVDYHDWDIRDQVATQSADFVVLTESNCRRGVPGYDINSPTCQQAIEQVVRGSTGRINEIFTPKVNVASETVEALVWAVGYGWEWENVGDFDVRANYTHMIEHTQTPLPGDEPIDLLEHPAWSSDPQDKADLALTWSRGAWSSTLYANWMAETPNYISRVADIDLGSVDSYTVYNASVSWQALDSFELSFLVNNLLDEMPPEDDTYPGTSGAPYNSSQYNVFGRAFYLEGRYSF
jgi:outer membrane receptor protein involved in Fe transport